MNILAIGAHPDDIELGCGGLLLKSAKAGHHIFMYVLTRGGASGNPEQRTQELFESAKYIGAQTLWVDNFEDTEVTVNKKLINHIEYFIHKAKADVVLTHSLHDYHHDHRSIAEATAEAARSHQNVLAYEIPLTRVFNPQIYYDISDVMDEKVQLVSLFKSQRNKTFTKSSAVRGLAEYRAFQSRMKVSIDTVECYEAVKLCLDKDFTLHNLQLQPLPQATIASINPIDIIEYNKSNHQVSKSGDGKEGEVAPTPTAKLETLNVNDLLLSSKEAFS